MGYSKALVKLLFYGEWVLGANKAGGVEDKETKDLIEYIFSQKEKFSLKSWFKDLKYGGEELKEPVTMLLLEKMFEYNEETFWFYLTKKLAARDAKKEHLKNGGKETDDEMIEELEWEYEEKYQKIFEKHGLDKLFLKED